MYNIFFFTKSLSILKKNFVILNVLKPLSNMTAGDINF